MDKNETETLAYEIADGSAQLDIESFCAGTWSFGGWLDVKNVDGSEEQKSVARAVHYLERRGKLKHHPQKPELVQVCK